MLKKFAAKLEKFLKSDDILHPFQGEILACSAADLRAGKWGGVICEPTGVGKTTIMGAEVKAFGYDSLILVPKKSIADNTRDEFRDNLGIPVEDIGVYHSDIPIAERRAAVGKKILITTPDSLRGLIKRGELNIDRFKYVGIDEAHKFRGPYTRALLQQYILHGQEIVVRAYTATDQFMDGTTVGTVLFGRTDYIHHTTLPEAVQKGFLCGAQVIIEHTEIVYEGNNPTGELTEKELEKLASRLGRDQKTISLFAQYVHEESGTVLRDKQSIWYATSIEHAKKIAHDLNKIFGEGYAVPISGESKNQKDILDDHKAGKFQAIINADLLIEGWNNPACVTCVMLRDTTSVIVATQAPGRVMRLDKNNPFKIAFVICPVDIGRPYSLTFADILGGTVVLPNNFTYPDVPPPKPSGLPRGKKLIDIGDIKVTVTDQEFLTYTKDRQDERDSIRAPEKPAGMLKKTDFALFINTAVTNPAFCELWEKLEAGNDPFDPRLKAGRYRSRTQTTFFVDKKESERVKKYLGLVSKPEEMLGKNNFAALIKTASTNPKFSELWSQLEAGNDPFDPPLKSGFYGGNKYFYVDKNEAERVKVYLGIKNIEKAEGMLNKAEFAALIKTASNNAKFSQFWSQLEAGNDPFDPPLIANKYGLGMSECFYIDQSEGERVKQHLGITNLLKTEKMLNKSEFGASLKVGNSPKFSKLWSQLEAGHDPFEPKLKCGYFRSGNRSVFCVDECEVERIRDYIGLASEKLITMLTKTQFARFINTSPENPRFLELWSQLESKNDPLDPPLKSGIYGNSKVFCVDQSEAERVKMHIAKEPDNMLSRVHFAQSINITHGTLSFSLLWRQLEAGNDPFDPPLKSEKRKKAFVVDKSEGSRVKEYLQKQKGNPSPVVSAEDTNVHEGKARGGKRSNEK